MKRLYNIFCGLLVLVLLFVGVVSLFDIDLTFSEIENRDLKTFPKFSLLSLMDGSFAASLQEYYADTFPGREGLAERYDVLNGFYTFGGAPETEPKP